MANFTLSPASGSKNGSIAVTPSASLTGRGPYSGTLTVTSKADSSLKRTVALTKTGALAVSGLSVATSDTLNGTYTETSATEIALPSAGGCVKVSFTANAKTLVLSDLSMPDGLYIKIGSQWIQADDTLGSSQAALSYLTYEIYGDPGATAAYACEMYFKYNGNTDTSSNRLAAISVTAEDDNATASVCDLAVTVAHAEQQTLGIIMVGSRAKVDLTLLNGTDTAYTILTDAMKVEGCDASGNYITWSGNLVTADGGENTFNIGAQSVMADPIALYADMQTCSDTLLGLTALASVSLVTFRFQVIGTNAYSTLAGGVTVTDGQNAYTQTEVGEGISYQCTAETPAGATPNVSVSSDCYLFIPLHITLDEGSVVNPDEPILDPGGLEIVNP